MPHKELMAIEEALDTGLAAVRKKQVVQQSSVVKINVYLFANSKLLINIYIHEA